ncbi:MAG TPA: tetratricopeptide repeat protein [Anaerolineales bacterium]|nr:tetratricopeptide repeat protein [Anaerolineales bacterium]
MPRNPFRVFLVLLLIFLAIFTPLVVSGYIELNKAAQSSSYAEAARHYHNAAQRLPWRADLYELSGHADYYAKDYQQADAAYQSAFQRQALSPEGWVAWGDVNYLKDDPQRATEIWEQALGQANPSDHLYSRLAQIYQSNNDFSKAAEYLEKYVSTHLEDASAHYRLGLLLTLSDPNRALSELTGASGLDPKFDPAVETLRDALNLASLAHSDSARLVITGRGLGLVNEWQLAHAAFESAVTADGKNAEAWAWLGEADQQTGGHARGGVELDRALALDSYSSIVRGLRGLHFQRIGDFRQALAEFQFAASLEPKNPTWFVSIGEAHAKLGDLIQALKAYQTATTLAPDDPNYWRLLAIFCAQNNVNIRDVGLPAAQKMVVLTKEDAASLDLLGWLLLLDARYQEAGRMLARSLALDPQSASAHYHLGLLHLQTGDRASAYDDLIRSRDLGSAEAETLLEQYFP